MKKILLILGIIILSSFAEVTAWGKVGHRTIGEIAERQLTPEVREKVRKLLEGQSLAVVSTWADEMRSNTEFDEFAKWHYINLYLKYLVHMVGDLHQPLHTGREEDWGGNKIKVNFKGRKGAENWTNLHDLWDAGIIDDYKMSYTEYADKLINQFDNKLDFPQGNSLEWSKESHSYVPKIYETTAGTYLSYDYVYEVLPIIDQRLYQAGIRLGNLLNDIFSEHTN